jgi:hypothetical protein
MSQQVRHVVPGKPRALKKLDQGLLGLRNRASGPYMLDHPGQDVTDALVQTITLPNGMYMIL